MGSLFDDSTLVNDQDAVGIPYGGETVGDEEDGPICHQPFQCDLNLEFRFGIQRRCGLVENEDGSILEQRPGYGDPLSLPAGEFYPPFPDYRIVAQGQLFDEPMGIGRIGGRHDFLL